MLGKLATPTDATAALDRIAAVADPDDVNVIRAELAWLRLVLDSGADDDVDFGSLSLKGTSSCVVGFTTGKFRD